MGFVHIALAVAALASGLAVALLPKGTRRHRLLGRVYVASMLGLNLTALAIYNLFGVFGPFHVAALISLATVAAGWVPALRVARCAGGSTCTPRSWPGRTSDCSPRSCRRSAPGSRECRLPRP
jgi:uncharacterized membrane protein